MKHSIIAIALSLLAVIAHAQSSSDASATISKLLWLEGDWIRSNARPGISGLEKWKKVSESKLEGFGITMKGTDTLETEKTSIIIQDNVVYYVADVPENKNAVYFKITSIGDGEFVCENPQHDFPKMISYKKQGNQLTATISGNGKTVTFLFEKVKGER